MIMFQGQPEEGLSTTVHGTVLYGVKFFVQCWKGQPSGFLLTAVVVVYSFAKGHFLSGRPVGSYKRGVRGFVRSWQQKKLAPPLSFFHTYKMLILEKVFCSLP